MFHFDSVPFCAFQVVNLETGKLCGPNEDGELWMKGPGNMRYYHNNKEATERTIDADGYVHSGRIIIRPFSEISVDCDKAHTLCSVNCLIKF